MKGYNFLWDNTIGLRNNLFRILCTTLIFSAFFTNVLHIRHLGTKLQLTEIAFLFTIPFIPYKRLIEYQLKNNRGFILIVLTYLIFDLTSSVLSHRTSALIESAGRFYLLGLFTILSYYFSLFDKTTLITKLTKLLLFISAVIVALAICGYIQVFTKGRSPYIYIAYNYPYFGSMYRFIGPTIYPTMLISSLTFVILFLGGILKHTGNKKWVNSIVVLLLICALLTLSKSLILLLMSGMIFGLKKFRLLNKKSLIFITIIFTITMVLFTHCIVVNKTSSQAKSLKSTIFTSNKVLFETNRYIVFEANYLAVKRAAINMATVHPFFGIGTGNFNKALQVYKQKGLFPKKLPNFDPHSTYLGVLVENGLFAEIMLLIMFGFIFNEFVRQKNLLTDNFLLALFLIFLTFLIDGIATDILNFRHLWLFFAISLTYLQQTKPAIDS